VPVTSTDARDAVALSGVPATAGDLLELVRTGQAQTRADLSRLTGLSRTAVLSRVTALVDAGWISPGEELASTGGRPPGSLVFNRDAGVVLAVAVGRSRSQLGVFDLDGQEVVALSRDHEVGVGPDDLMPEVARGLAELLAASPGPVAGIGMSLPGTVDGARGMSLDSPVMRGWDGVALAPYLDDVTDAPLFLANDAVVLAESELFHRPEAPRHALVVKASTGLGLGIVEAGRVVRGHAGATGEIGHCKVPAAAGLSCRCGASGCLEAVAGGWALVSRLQEQGGEVGHIRDLVARAVAGDPVSRGLLRESGRHLGEVLAVAINLLNPEVVVIGGDMGAAFDLYVAGVRETVYAETTAIGSRDLLFRPAAHGDRAGLVGCAALAIEGVLDPAVVDAGLREAAR
jgi:predicted NBD/HSP70 family sugar kinase